MGSGTNGKIIPVAEGTGGYRYTDKVLIDSSSAGVQTYFMTRNELFEHFDAQMRKYGRLNLATMKVERLVGDRWVEKY